MVSLPRLYQAFLQCSGVTTDSRNCPKGSLFIALKGENFNGNRFACQALEQGCAYAVVDEPEYALSEEDRILLVLDGLQALQQLAQYHRRQLGTRIIGITGTNGKTTTKELIAAALSAKYNLLYTQGNLNNQIGVPLTLLRLRSDHELAVIEMGASHPGDIKELVDIAEPDFGIITNVAPAHLEGFGSFEGVIRTKGELYEYLRPQHSTVFVNASNPFLKPMLQGLNAVYYSALPAAEGVASPLAVSGHVTACDPFLSLEWGREGDPQTYSVTTLLIGDYNIENVLAAVTIATYFEVEPAAICRALAEYTPSNNRSQLKVTAHNRLVIDAYNANPTSMRAAVENFLRIDAPRKAVILGDMKELGAVSVDEHRAIMQLVTEGKLDRAVFVGPEFAAAFRELGVSVTVSPPHPAVELYADVHEFITHLHASILMEDYTILIKGSNSMKLALLAKEL